MDQARRWSSAPTRNTPRLSPNHGITDGWQAVDIGTASIALFQEEIARAKTILWNGPPGIFEIPDRNLATLVPMVLLTPLLVALAPPFIRPFRWRRLLCLLQCRATMPTSNSRRPSSSLILATSAPWWAKKLSKADWTASL